jgi:hypothetical protein
MTRRLFSLALVLLAETRAALAADECQPITWANPPEARDVYNNPNMYAAATPAPHPVVEARQASTPSPLPVGAINCRAWDSTYDDASYYTCKWLADSWSISVDWFFRINPTLNRDCSNIQKNTRYCVQAYLEPLRSTNGRCGPQFNNATCSGTAKQCCNAQTWTCGNSTYAPILSLQKEHN